MDALALVSFIYQAGDELVNRCKLVQHGVSEAERIADRTLRIVGLLEEAAGEFSPSMTLDSSLVDLKKTLEDAQDRVKVG